MHQTTLRFTADLWAQLEREAKRHGVSAAQYVRDAALARLAYTAGQRGDPMFGDPDSATPPEPQIAGEPSNAVQEQAAERETLGDSSAVWVKARLARERARSVRADSRAMHSAPRTH